MNFKILLIIFSLFLVVSSADAFIQNVALWESPDGNRSIYLLGDAHNLGNPKNFVEVNSNKLETYTNNKEQMHFFIQKVLEQFEKENISLSVLLEDSFMFGREYTKENVMAAHPNEVKSSLQILCKDNAWLKIETIQPGAQQLTWTFNTFAREIFLNHDPFFSVFFKSVDPRLIIIAMAKIVDKNQKKLLTCHPFVHLKTLYDQVFSIINSEYDRNIAKKTLIEKWKESKRAMDEIYREAKKSTQNPFQTVMSPNDLKSFQTFLKKNMPKYELMIDLQALIELTRKQRGDHRLFIGGDSHVKAIEEGLKKMQWEKRFPYPHAADFFFWEKKSNLMFVPESQENALSEHDFSRTIQQQDYWMYSWTTSSKKLQDSVEIALLKIVENALSRQGKILEQFQPE